MRLIFSDVCGSFAYVWGSFADIQGFVEIHAQAMMTSANKCIHTHIQIYYINLREYVYEFSVRLYVRIYVRIYVRMYVRIYVHIYVQIYIHM